MSTKRYIKLDGQTLSVNCIDWDIKVSKPDFKSAEMCEEYGLFEKRRNLITVQEGTDSVTEFNSVLHEIIHGIVWLGTLNASGQPLDTDEKEELVVNTLTNYLVGVLKQNKWFRDYLVQCFDKAENKK